MPISTTPAQYALILIDLGESLGCSRSDLLQGTTFADGGMGNIGARIRDADFDQLVANAVELTGDPALGLKLGLRLNLSAHAVLGQAFMTCRDLGEVIDLFLKYYHLLASRLQLGFEVNDEHCVLTMESEPGDLTPEFGYELLYGALVNTLRGLFNDPTMTMCLEFPYPEPAHGDIYREVFGDDLHFGTMRGRVIIPRSLMDKELPSSNPVLRRLYESECARLLEDLREDDSVAEQTLRLLRKLEGQYPHMPQLAQMLNLSPRTYRRRLDEEEQSFQKLLDQVRAEHATRYLQNTRLPLSSIAYMVGFSDTSNFRRAYTKWTGKSPREVRNG
ncbi:MAG: AraC family transcriptional regulator [Halioglobus sp.]